MRRVQVCALALCFVLSLCVRGRSATVTVDRSGAGDFSEIQPAIDAAADGDTVLVAPGEYEIREPLDFNRLHDPRDPESPPLKNITVRSEAGARQTTVRMAEFPDDASRAGVVIFHSGESEASCLEGFTLTGGRGSLIPGVVGRNSGGGILVGPNCAPRVERCTIKFNVAEQGGGVHCQASFPSFSHCTIAANAAVVGGGIRLALGAERISRCAIFGNNAGGCGGGLFANGSAVSLSSSLVAANAARAGGGVMGAGSSYTVVSGCTVVANISRGGGVSGLLLPSSGGRVTSSIVWDNQGGPMRESTVVVDHSCLRSPAPWPGDNNINDDPLFRQAGEFDFESFVTLSLGGEEFLLPDFVIDPGYYNLQAGSPCIDTGRFHDATAIDLEGFTRPCGAGTDMGSYERGSCRPRIPFLRGDSDANGRLNLSDAIFLLRALFGGGEQPSCRKSADVDDRGTLAVTDAVYLLNYLFRQGPRPPAPTETCGPDPTADALDCERYPCAEASRAVAFVVDRSGSMQDVGELATAKQEVSQRLQDLETDAKFTVLFFDSDVIAFPPGGGLLSADDATRVAALSFVSGTLGGGGGTCPTEALVLALDLLRGSEAVARHIVYIGDGGGTCHGANEVAYLEQMVSRVTTENAGEARIDCLGVRMETRARHEEFLEQLAEANGGEYLRIP